MAVYFKRTLFSLILSAFLILFCILFILSDVVYYTSSNIPAKRPKTNNNYQFLSEILEKVYVDFEELSQPIVDLDPKCPRWTELAQSYRRCLTSELRRNIRDNALWFRMYISLKLCGGDLLKHILHVKYLVNRDDIKLVVLPDTKHVPCTSITIGIGNDTSAEVRLRELLPSVRFFGADPVESSGSIFTQLGSYSPVAISSESGQLNASVLIDGNYYWNTVHAMSLSQYLMSLKIEHVDFLFLDAEGVEYNIIEQIDEINSRSITICQISIELHGPLQKYGQTKASFAYNILKFLTNTSFIAIWAPKPLMHNRLFVINWKDAYCINKFLYKWC